MLSASFPRRLLSRSASTLPLVARHPTSPPIPTHADVVVIGGGHAGVEAAAAAYRVFANSGNSNSQRSHRPHRVVLLTQRLDTVGEMACNPAIGGVGKGTLVREIDALGGIMGQAADASGIHFKVLNRSRGPAVQGPRCQCDRTAYKAAVQRAIVDMIDDDDVPHVQFDVVEASADDLVVLESQEAAAAGVTAKNIKKIVQGVVITPTDATQEQTITASRVVVTTGTFLRGRVHLGRENYPAGRHLENSNDVEPPSTALASTFERLGLPLSTLNTGTPPRLSGATIDWNHPSMEKQDSEMLPMLETMSFMTDVPALYNYQDSAPFLPTMQVYTNSNTHTMVRNNLDGLPTYRTNEGEGHGPR